ncbi:hypothetical protein [Siphonobacter sp. SORGH_AS_0500]|uniref:hypothetical protein n=1 Tax=Siphonobacter sp. SORGH_AS_0500 TaxID=1864824 RepID=UPI0028629462|nr:hypothetical protein [Siphonobacter sp. SORGH_AS_0500]MDR6196168.1 hypothetical protein [Siphonobacter sp. SORGH_AS_0500]
MSWSSTLKQQILNLLPDNISQLITPGRVRTAMGLMLDFLEKSIQFAVPEPQKRTITVFRGTDRSWPITLSGSANTIGLFAFTTVTRRTLILGEHFVVTGSGVNRIFSISEETFDDLYPGEKIIYQENVKGGQIEFKIPQIGIQQVNGEEKYVWQYPEEPDSLTVIAGVNFDPRKVTVVVNASNGILVEHSLNSMNLRIDVLTPENRPVSFVSAFPVDATHVQLEMPEGETFPVKLLISAYPQSQ